MGQGATFINEYLCLSLQLKAKYNVYIKLLVIPCARFGSKNPAKRPSNGTVHVELLRCLIFSKSYRLALTFETYWNDVFIGKIESLML